MRELIAQRIIALASLAERDRRRPRDDGAQGRLSRLSAKSRREQLHQIIEGQFVKSGCGTVGPSGV